MKRCGPYLILLTLATFAACSSDTPNADSTTITTTPPSQPTATSAPPTTTPAPTTTRPAPTTTTIPLPGTSIATATTAPLPTTDTPADDIDAAVAVWVDTFTRAAAPGATAEALADVADPAAANQLITFTHAASDTPTVTPGPTGSANANGTITIEDCALVQPSLHDPESFWFTGTVTKQPDNTWKVTNVELHDAGCIPAAIANEVLAAYDVFVNAPAQFGNPPNPTHPLIKEVYVDHQAATEVLAKWAAAGQVWHQEVETHPEFVIYKGDAEVEIQDCTTATGLVGVYNADGTPDVETQVGNQYFIFATFTRIDGRWIVQSFAETDNSDCAPYDVVEIPVVPG